MPAHHTQSRKRKRDDRTTKTTNLETTKPTAVFKAPGAGRPHTLSLALPGSVIANAQTHDLKNALAGRIARAAAVFCVDEIVVFDDGQSPPSKEEHSHRHGRGDNGNGYEGDYEHTGWSDPDHFLSHILSYLECPPNLRKKLFPMHSNLRTAGALPSLDMPHHLKPNEWCEYREGVTLDGEHGRHRASDSASKKKKKHHPPNEEVHTNESGQTTVVDTGLTNRIEIDSFIPPNTRVTVKLPKDPPQNTESIHAEVVPPTDPREEAGYYWGYSVRQCSSLSSVFTECPFEGGYDASIGTSERGQSLERILPHPRVLLSDDSISTSPLNGDSTPNRLPERFLHLLIAFGGVAGLEAAAAADETLAAQGIEPGSVSQLFDAWLDVCPGQGSRTIRTEEAVWLGLGATKPYVDGCGAKPTV